MDADKQLNDTKVYKHIGADLIPKLTEKSNKSFEIYKKMFNVRGRSTIFNCGAPIEKVSEFLNSHLHSVMGKGLFYIKDSGDFSSKIKRIGTVPVPY